MFLVYNVTGQLSQHDTIHKGFIWVLRTNNPIVYTAVSKLYSQSNRNTSKTLIIQTRDWNQLTLRQCWDEKSCSWILEKQGRDEDSVKTNVAWNQNKCDLIIRHAIVEPLPIDGDLKGYLSGRSTRTFHTPPSYGAARGGDTKKNNERTRQSTKERLSFHWTSYSILHALQWI